jgi:ATP-dependent DNA helicase RecQ
MNEVVRMEKTVSTRKRPARNGQASDMSIFPQVHVSMLEDKNLFEALRKYRLQLSREQKVPPYIILSDKVLHSLATIKPTNIEAFGNISGIGEYKKNMYGLGFITLIHDFVNS